MPRIEIDARRLVTIFLPDDDNPHRLSVNLKVVMAAYVMQLFLVEGQACAARARLALGIAGANEFVAHHLSAEICSQFIKSCFGNLREGLGQTSVHLYDKQRCDQLRLRQPPVKVAEHPSWQAIPAVR